jgi:hypothetical protein
MSSFVGSKRRHQVPSGIAGLEFVESLILVLNQCPVGNIYVTITTVGVDARKHRNSIR